MGKSKIIFFGRIVENMIDELIISNDKNRNIKIKDFINSNISKDDISKALTNISKDIINNVAQKNLVGILNQTIASNKMSFEDIECDVVNFADMTQETESKTETDLNIKQSQVSNIKNDIKDKLNNSIPPTSSDNTFITDVLTGDINKKLILVDNLAKILSGFAKPDEKNTIIDLFKKELNLPSNFEVKENTDIQNKIENNISQENFATCSSQIVADNEIMVKDIKCDGGDFDVNNIKQTAIANSILTCTIDQSLDATINNNVMTTINDNVTSILNSVPEDKLQDAVEIIIGAYHKIVDIGLPKEQKETIRKTKAIDGTTEKQELKEMTKEEQKSLDELKKNLTGNDNIEKSNNRTTLIIIVVVIIVLFILLLLFLL